jgi:hypothetical protein
VPGLVQVAFVEPQPVLLGPRVLGGAGAEAPHLADLVGDLLADQVRRPPVRRGRTAAELADDLFADASRVVTLRAEMSRLRRVVGAPLRHQPYRIDAAVARELLLPDDRDRVLPGSSAPVLDRLR